MNHSDKSHRYFRFWVLCGICLWWLHPALAAPGTLDVGQIGKEPASLSDYFSVLEDPSGKLSLADVRRPELAAQFSGVTAHGGSLNFGLSRSAYWLRLNLKNGSASPVEQLLEISTAYLYQADLFQISNVITSQQSGYGRPFSQRSYKHRFVVFPLDMAANSEQVLYLRVESPMALEVPAKLWQRSAFQEYESLDLLLQSMYFGMVFAMVSFNFLLWILLSDPIYGRYLFFVFGVSFCQAGMTGMGGQFLWGNNPEWVQISVVMGGYMLGIGYITFMQSMLGTAKTLPRYHKILTITVIANWLALISCFISYSITLLLFFGVLNSLLTLVAAAMCVHKGQRSAKLFLTAFTFLLVGIMLAVLRTIDLVPTTFGTINGMQIGSAMEMIFLAFALADRFNQMRQEKAKVQNELLQSQRETLQAQRETLQAQRETMQAQAEKVTSLTQLVSNMAHEINTPIGAVKSSGKNISDALGDALTNLPRLYELLEPTHRNLFHQLTSRANAGAASSPALTSREERSMKVRVGQQLKQNGIENIDWKARVLLGLRADTALLEYLPLLQHPESDFILHTAQSIGGIIVNTNNIAVAVDRVSRIVTMLRSFSQAEHMGEMTEVCLQDNLEGVLTMVGSQIKHQMGNVELVRQYQDLPPLRCLSDGLMQVWTHLIQNALQAMNFKGTLTLSLYRIGNQAVVSVADTGAGIPVEIRGRIFEPFFTTRPAGEGSGLGLDIAKKIVDRHYGRIEVQSEVSVGTTFLVYLPL
jgi:signal transduction histidine kinase